MTQNSDRNQYFHVEIVREPEREPERRRRRNRSGGPVPPTQNPSQHGQELTENIGSAVQQISRIRGEYGIDPAQLLVLEFHSINVDLREYLENRFSLWIVDERKEKVNDQYVYRFLVQFPDWESRRDLEQEVNLYQAETSERGILTQIQRGNFFDSLQQIRSLSREERIGNRLREEGYPEQESFFLDLDLWHPGEENAARQILSDIRLVCQRHGGQLNESVRTSSLLLAKVRGSRQLAEALLELDLVACVDLPPRLSGAYSSILLDTQPPNLQTTLPSPDSPIVCVIDSGVVSGHPFLMNWVVEERDFDSGENTPADQNGHGTSVAGIVVYGDVAQCIETQQWQPRVQICSAKVLKNDSFSGEAVFPNEARVEEVIERVIHHFVKERNCRIFNLSLGISSDVFRGGRQFALAEKLDELARELDIVIVIAAGNRLDPPIPQGASTRAQFRQALRRQMLEDEEQRICNPATAALALTVGAIARSEALGHHFDIRGVKLRDAVAASPEHAPSPFSRVGPGIIKGAVKPDMVHYGGNYAVQTLAGGNPRWVKRHILLGEPTLCLETNGRFLGSQVGTSFACPHVSHAAAIASTSIEASIRRSPSANLIRALVASATFLPPCSQDWLGNEDEMLRLIGYGMCLEDDISWSKQNRVRLLAMDNIGLDKLHLYKVKIPDTFLTTKGRRGITVALAYDPPVRTSRQQYLARTMWFDALQGLTNDEVENYRASYTGREPPQLPSWAEIKLRPTKTKVEWSTLQVRKVVWKKRPSLRIPQDETIPAIHILVGCKQRFPADSDTKQGYGLVVFFWHENEQVRLYQDLPNLVRVSQVRIRV